MQKGTPTRAEIKDGYEERLGELTEKEHPLRGGKSNLVFCSVSIKVPDCLNLFFFIHLKIETEI